MVRPVRLACDRCRVAAADAVLRVCLVWLLLAAAGCVAGLRGDDAQIVGPQRGPLPRAEELLNRSLDRSENDFAVGHGADTNRLAHLRMTRAALDYIEAGEDQRAFDLLERAISIDGGTGFAYLYLGYVHLRHGEGDQATVFLDRAAVLLPADALLRAEVVQLQGEASGQFAGPKVAR